MLTTPAAPCNRAFAAGFRYPYGMLHIRPAEAADVAVILRLIRSLAEYEREPAAVTATEADLLRDGFGARPLFHVVLAEWDGAAVGFGFYFFNYSTWQGKPGLYLEDLFVEPAFRGYGIGKALLVHLAQIAVTHNCGRFVWQVLDWNEPAIRFYEKLGGRILREWLTVRVVGEDLARLAATEVDARPPEKR
jgi:GNAT superfamily N-acetyltransferase